MVMDEHIVTTKLRWKLNIRIQTINTDRQVMKKQYHDMMVLQAWFSPAFPIGAFSYSHGIETAIQEAMISEKDSLTEWIACLLTYGSGWNDCLFLKAAFEMGEGVNDLCLSICTGEERYRETVELGAAFTRSVNTSYGMELDDGLAYPVAVGLAASKHKLDMTLTAQSYLQAFAANLISVGVRTIPIGQQAGQDSLLSLFAVIENIMPDLLEASLDQLGGATFMSEIMSMKHENANPRIFRT